jgi:hypothetical protein
VAPATLPSAPSHESLSMKNQDGDFLSAQDHFDVLLKTLPSEQQSLHKRMTNVRVETAYAGRTFILYKMYKREPEFIDRLVVRDFDCSDDEGASSLVQSTETGMEYTISYTPFKIPDQNVFLFLPLHAKLRWAKAASSKTGSLAFPLCIRTLSRVTLANGQVDLREKGVTYCETGVAYAREFEGSTV